MQKKHIAIFGVKYFPSRGGTSRVVENLLEHLTEHFDFTIYCYKHPEAATHMKGVNVVEFSEINIKGIGVFMYYFKCCMHLLFKGKYDLVHIHKTDAAFFIPFISKKAPCITTSHALPYMNDKWSKLGKTYFHMVERIYMNADTIQTSIAKPQADYYEEKYGKPVMYIPNGVEPGPSFDSSEADELLAKHQVEGEYLLFAARRIIPLKGLHHLIKALNQMKFTGTLVVAGEDDQLPEYTKELKESGKDLKIKFVGYVGSRTLLSALVSKAKLFIFPSEIEGMSMMLLEVGSLGTPMVCSDIPQNKAVLTGEEVLYFRSQDADDLEEKLDFAFANPSEMEEKAEKTMEKVASEYAVSKVVQQYVDLYNQNLYPSRQYAKA